MLLGMVGCDIGARVGIEYCCGGTDHWIGIPNITLHG